MSKFEKYGQFIEEYLNKNQDKEISINISEDISYLIVQAYREGYVEGKHDLLEILNNN